MLPFSYTLLLSFGVISMIRAAGTAAGAWILCPVCGNKTRVRIREDTVLKNFPLYCPKCKQEVLVNAEELNISVIKEPDA